MPALRIDQLRLRHLRFLALLSSAGSLAATAEALALTPSAASMTLKEIEGLFGVKLFRRQGRGMAPTEAGQALLPRCRTVLGEVAAMGTTLQGDVRPLLRIGAFPHTSATVLPGIVNRLTSAPAPWQVQIVDGSAQRLVQLLQHGEIDLMLGRLPQPLPGTGDDGTKAGGRKQPGDDSLARSGLAQRLLYDSRLSVVAARGHPLAGRRSVPMEQLLNWPWILPGPGSTTRVALDDAFLRRGLQPPVPAVESPSYFYSLAVVAGGSMLTCCAHSAALQGSQRTAILPVVVSQDPSPVSMIWRRESVLAQRAVALLA